MKLHINDSYRISNIALSDKAAILDIKPFMKEFSPRGEIRQPQWASELMKDYWE
jgi:tRNA (Thr-GGU) A37 N-methylase